MYNVTVSVSHPAHAPCEVGLSGPESHTPERMSELLLQAADAVQRRMGWPSILEELATLRATVLGVRSALDVDPETPNEKLAEVARTHYVGNVGTHPQNQPCRAAVILRAVLEGLGLPEVPTILAGPEQAGTMAAAIAERANQAEAELGRLVERFERVLIGLGLPPEFWASKVSHEDLSDLVDRIADNSDRWLSLTPERLACAFHNAFVERRKQMDGPRFEQWWAEWHPEDDRTQAEMVSFARVALRELGGRDLATDTARQRWLQALNQVRLEVGLPMRTAEQDQGASESDLVAQLIGELRLNAPSTPAAAPAKAVLRESFVEALAAAINDARDRGGSMWTAHDPWAQLDEPCRNMARTWTRNMLESAEIEVTPSAPATPEQLAPSAPATPEQLAVVMFDASQAVSSVMGSEPIPAIDRPGGWEVASGRRRQWWREMAQLVLDGVDINVPTSLLPVTPAQLARAMHEARCTAQGMPGVRAPLFIGQSWAKLDPSAREWFEWVAGMALAGLPQIAQADREQDAQFAAHMDTTVAGLRDELAQAEVDRNVALEALREIAAAVGMSFGAADDAGALGGITVTAVRQYVQERERASERARERALNVATRSSMYRGMVRGVIDQLGLPDETADDPKAFGEALRAELDRRGGKTAAFRFCVPAPEDWVIELRPVGPLAGDAEGEVSAALSSGAKLAMEDGTFTARLRYTGPLGQRPRDGALLVPSVSPVQLAQAWVETPTGAGPGLAWDKVDPAVRVAMTGHAGAVIERLSWSDLARQGRKQGLAWSQDWTIESLASPGEAYVSTPDGPQRIKVFRALEDFADRVDRGMFDSVKGLGREVNALQGFRRELASVLGVVVNEKVILGRASQLVDFERAHRACQGAEALERDLCERLAEVLGLDEAPQGGVWPWAYLLSRVAELVRDGRNVQAVTQGHHADLRAVRELRAAQDADAREQVRAEAAVASVHEQLAAELAVELGMVAESPLGGGWDWRFLLEKVRGLVSFREAAVFSFRSGAPGRVVDAMVTLIEAAGIAVDDSMPVDVVVQKAGDAAAILRSWPDVLRAVNAFDVNILDVEQPDEVEPTLNDFANIYYKSARRGTVIQTLERLLAAHYGEPLQDNPDTIGERIDELINNLFKPLREIGGMFGVDYASFVSKPRFAQHVLLAAREQASPTAEVTHWAACAEQIGAKLEHWAGLDPEPLSKLVTVPGVGIKQDRHTLRFAADVVRAQAAALMNGSEQHPLVQAVLADESWLPGLERPTPECGELHLSPTAGGTGNLVLSEVSESGVVTRSVTLSRHEFAPVGAALLLLHRHQVRAETLADLQAVVDAAEPAGEPEMVLTARVLPGVPEQWCYGPNAIDPDPGKRWHIGCGGEVLWVDNVLICRDCSHQWEEGAEPVEQPEAAPGEPDGSES